MSSDALSAQYWCPVIKHECLQVGYWSLNTWLCRTVRDADFSCELVVAGFCWWIQPASITTLSAFSAKHDSQP